MTATIPPVPAPSFSDANMARWGQQVALAISSLRSADLVTTDDLVAFAKKYGIEATAKRAAQPGDIQVQDGAIPLSDLVERLLANRQFQDALTGKTTTTAASGQDDVAVHDLEARLMQVINDLSDATDASIKALQNSTGGVTRGPINAWGILTYWDNEQAGRCVYWVLFNGGDAAIAPPSYPNPITSILVIGDRVTLRNSASASSTYMETRQWLGSKVGWVKEYATNAFDSVANLPQFFDGVLTVIPEAGKLANTAQVRGSTLKLGTGGSTANPTLDAVIHELDYNAVGTQSYNTLQELAKANSKRGPIWASYGLGDLSYSDSTAAQLIWAQLNRGNTWQGFYPSMPDPSTFLVTGDTVTVSWGKDQYGAASQMVSKMWHGGSLGWQFFTSPYVAFQDVQNLPQFLDGVLSVLSAVRGKIKGEAIIDGTSTTLAQIERRVFGYGDGTIPYALDLIVSSLSSKASTTSVSDLAAHIYTLSTRLDQMETSAGHSSDIAQISEWIGDLASRVGALESA